MDNIMNDLFQNRLIYAFSILDAYCSLKQTYEQLGGNKFLAQLIGIKYRSKIQDEHFDILKKMMIKVDNLKRELLQICDDKKIVAAFNEYYKNKTDISTIKQKIEIRNKEIEYIKVLIAKNKDLASDLQKLIIELENKNTVDKLQIILIINSCVQLRRLIQTELNS